MKRKLKYYVEIITLNQYNCQQVINIENVKNGKEFFPMKLLDQVCDKDMGEIEISLHISFLATDKKVASSTHNQVLKHHCLPL